MDFIPFNSRSKLHKEKFGALADGETTYFRVIMPRSMQCTGVKLVIHRDDDYSFKAFDFFWEKMEGDNEEWWKLEYKTEAPGLYWYHFEYQTSWGKSYITNIGNSVGALSTCGEDWQLTVYDKNFTTPDWLKGGIIYQIFPDRFYNSGTKKNNVPSDRILRTDNGCPYWKAENGIVKNNDFFCGDLKGIEKKLDYIKSLGVNCIYLNPIFEAQSNHRYDTADYMKIDPLLGNEKDLKSLVKTAEKKGIKIILDGVFSHTGADSRYFNINKRYDETGAYNSKDSEYFSWYNFKNYPDDYDCWWGVKILPEVKEDDEKFMEFILGKNGVINHWLDFGIGGWRLDVADELPDIFLDKLRKTVKENNPYAIVLGEVWEDASNKYSYGGRRKYLLGEELDSVMNYPFANAVMSFVKTAKADGFHNKIMTVTENYPTQVINVLMNHIGTHDTIRAITDLAGDSPDYRNKDWQSEKVLSDEQLDLGIKLMKIASAIQFMLPGVPSIYYGDEVGLQGYSDPFNRRCFPWGNENTDLLNWYKKLGEIRNNSTALKSGEYVPVSDILQAVAFIRKDEKENLMIIANRNNDEIIYNLPEEMYGYSVLCGGEKVNEYSIKVPPVSAVIIRRIF